MIGRYTNYYYLTYLLFLNDIIIAIRNTNIYIHKILIWILYYIHTGKKTYIKCVNVRKNIINNNNKVYDDVIKCL